jgi:endonuclease/exonuclease/phosphatase family metal-dependent hydrolase
MRIATFKLENMFDRPRAMNLATWAEGRPALEAHQRLNELFNRATYNAATKRQILELLEQQGLLRTDSGPWMKLRKIRGKLIHRPNNGAPTIVAGGRSSWIGWVELHTESVSDTARLNTARVMNVVNADVLAVVEADDRPGLVLFNSSVLPLVGAAPYEHVHLFDGNDDRGIDVGLVTRAAFPIRGLRSHVDDRTPSGARTFSRDCPEYEVELPDGSRLWVLVNHLKSKGYGSPASNNARRRLQAERVRALVDEHLAAGDENVVVLGDLNDTPGSDPLAPLLAEGSVLRDIADHPAHDDGGRPGTHGNCTASGKLDYILVSPALWQRVTAAGIERRGMWGGANGTLWPHFDEVASAIDAASDHAAVWVELAD